MDVPTRKYFPVPPFLRTLRYVLGTLATMNVLILAYGLVLIGSNRNAETGRLDASFVDTPQIATNNVLLIGMLYSFKGQTEWTIQARWCAGLLLVGANLALVSSSFKRIFADGGCGNEAEFSGWLKTRCYLQWVVGVAGYIWAVLLLAEIGLTGHLRKKHEARMAAEWAQDREAARIRAQMVIEYRPDLSLAGGAALHRRRDALEGEEGLEEEGVEMDDLPAYERRQVGPQPTIIDLGHMGAISGGQDAIDPELVGSRTSLHLAEDGPEDGRTPSPAASSSSGPPHPPLEAGDLAPPAAGSPPSITGQVMTNSTVADDTLDTTVHEPLPSHPPPSYHAPPYAP